MNGPARSPITPKPSQSAAKPIAIIAAVAGGIALIAGIIVLVIWASRPSKIPLLNSDTVTLASFIATESYTRLPFDRQQNFMRILEDREDNGELKRAFVAGKLTEAQYRAAIHEAWLGEQLKRSEKYTALPAGPARIRFINEMLDRKQQKKKNDDGGAAGKSKTPRPGNNDEGESEADPDEVKRDPSATKLRMDSWPPEVREQVEAFRAAYEQQKEVREAAATPTRPQGTPAGSPSTRTTSAS